MPASGLLESCGASETLSAEISREGVSNGTTPGNVLFGINMHEALKLPLIWREKHLGRGSSIKGHTGRSCQKPGVLFLLVCVTPFKGITTIKEILSLLTTTVMIRFILFYHV